MQGYGKSVVPYPFSILDRDESTVGLSSDRIAESFWHNILIENRSKELLTITVRFPGVHNIYQSE